MSRELALRPVRPVDEPFLRLVYASTRADELAVVPWSDTQREAFLRAQFDAQDAWYREHYPGASYDVVLVDGVPAGRLYVLRAEREIRIMDIALLPEYRGDGVGTSLVGELLLEADARGDRVTIHVERLNPALSLYERLGFEAVEDKGVYLLLERQPAT